MPDIPVRAEFLKKLHLFRGLTDEELKSVAAEMDEQTFDEAETVFVEGTPADAFYIVYQGKVTISRKGKKDAEIRLASLYRGDYFGEQGLLTKRSHNATVRADKGTTVLKLYYLNFKRLLSKVPGLYPNFRVMMDSRRLAREKQFRWMWPDEVIYFAARKHPFILYQNMVAPLLIVITATLLLSAGFSIPSMALAGIGAFIFVIAIALAIWFYYDWENDYYIVTNQRVVWLEKVVLMYDSRQEAPMNTILSVGTETDYFGRMLDFGVVVVRTFTGQMRLLYVGHPKQAAAMIEEYWQRTKEKSRQTDEQIMKDAIRRKMGAPAPAKPAPAAPAKPLAQLKPIREPNLVQIFLRDAFKMRIEAGGVVTYRKHWFVLIRDTLPQILVLLILLGFFVFYPIYIGAPPLWMVLLLSVGFAIGIFWWIYGFVDWSNDIYQVTADQIVDVYKKPFGVEERKAAPLDSILSTEYKRRGIFGLILNYGVVNIAVGGAKFDFEDVADPPTVHMDIVQRMQVRLQKKRESETAGERERMAEWLAMYHKTVEEINKEKGQSRSSNPE